MQLTGVCEGVNQYSANVFHYRVMAVVGAPLTITQVAQQWSTRVAPFYKNALSAVASYYGAKAQIIKPTLEPAAVAFNGAGAGAIAGDILPGQVAGLITHYSAFASKNSRGRNYIPFPSEASSDPTGDPAAAYVALLDAFRAGMNGADFQLIVGAQNITLRPSIYSRNLGVAFDIVTGVTRLGWATQRRRGALSGGDDAPF